MTWRGARLLRPALQFFLVLLAVYTGLTRISDYRHHPSDVLTGYIQGALTAYWVVSLHRLLVFFVRPHLIAVEILQLNVCVCAFFPRPSTSRPCLKARVRICLRPRPWRAPCHPTTLSAKPHPHQPLPVAWFWVDRRFEECETISCEVEPHTSEFRQSVRENKRKRERESGACETLYVAQRRKHINREILRGRVLKTNPTAWLAADQPQHRSRCPCD